MSVQNLIDELDEILEDAWSLPLSGGKTLVDAAKVQQLLDDIRLSLPKEITQAKAIVADRSKIIRDAKIEAETIIRVAEERAKSMVEQSEIVKQSEDKANEIISQAQVKSKEIHKATNEYVDDLMKRTDDTLSSNLSELRKTRQSIKSSYR